ncbi:MAG: hypothetical protein ABI866_06735 [Dokdonella sp.]
MGAIGGIGAIAGTAAGTGGGLGGDGIGTAGAVGAFGGIGAAGGLGCCAAAEASKTPTPGSKTNAADKVKAVAVSKRGRDTRKFMGAPSIS